MRRIRPASDWEKQRLGKITASNFFKIMKKGKKTFLSDGAQEYLWGVLAEKQTGTKLAEYEKDAMLWGASTEIDAASALLDIFPDFEYFGGYDQRFYPFNKWSGGSPDGSTKDVIIEIKCPYNTANHMQNILISTGEQLKKKREEYYWQIIFNCIILKKDAFIFASFDPDYTQKPLHLVQDKIEIGDKEIALSQLEKAIEFLEEKEKELKFNKII